MTFRRSRVERASWSSRVTTSTSAEIAAQFGVATGTVQRIARV
jgi:hypothetical protein